jgi:hypothetical protein
MSEVAQSDLVGTTGETAGNTGCRGKVCSQASHFIADMTAQEDKVSRGEARYRGGRGCGRSLHRRAAVGVASEGGSPATARGAWEIRRRRDCRPGPPSSGRTGTAKTSSRGSPPWRTARRAGTCPSRPNGGPPGPPPGRPRSSLASRLTPHDPAPAFLALCSSRLSARGSSLTLPLTPSPMVIASRPFDPALHLERGSDHGG